MLIFIPCNFYEELQLLGSESYLHNNNPLDHWCGKNKRFYFNSIHISRILIIYVKTKTFFGHVLNCDFKVFLKVFRFAQLKANVKLRSLWLLSLLSSDNCLLLMGLMLNLLSYSSPDHLKLFRSY